MRHYVVLKDGSGAQIPAPEREGLRSAKKDTKHTFRPKKNPVLLKVDSPGVLEVDWIPGMEARTFEGKGVLPPIDFARFLQKPTLRNHRFSKVSKGSLVAEPPIVVFDSYIPYQTFTKTLTIKNTSKFAHRFRTSFNPMGVYSPFFKLYIQKTPVTGDGLIAPGLSCVYHIEFTPNSFANASEELVISSENGEVYIIPIVAARQKPDLQLPAVLDIGYCMEGRELTFEKTATNSGGEGRYSLMLPNVPLGPFEIFEEIGLRKDVESKSVSLGAFGISPSFVHVNHGDSVRFQIKYSPAPLTKKTGTVVGSVFQREETQTFKFACDNCDILELLIVATVQEPKVQVVSYESAKDGLVVVPRNANTVETRQDAFEINFGAENYGVPKTCVLKIFNPTNLELPFDWKVVNENMQALRHDLTLVPNMTDIFQISPSSGCIQPLSEMEFTLTFLTKESKKYTTTMEMIIPASNHVRQDSKKRRIPDAPRAVARIQLFGEGAPFSGQLNQELIFLPDGFLMGQSFRQLLTFTNESISAMEFEWSIVGIDPSHCSVAISNPSGVILPNEQGSFELEFVGRFPAAIDGELRCQTSKGFGPTLVVPVKGAVSFPATQLSFDIDFVDLGLLSLGTSTVKPVPLTNSSGFRLPYSVSVVQNGEQHNCFVQLEPNSGVLDPGETVLVHITYIPLWYQQLRGTLQVYIQSETTTQLVSATDIIATTETPFLRVKNASNFVTAFVAVPFKWTVLLENTRDLPVEYSFADMIFDDCRVQFHPPQGTVSPQSSAEMGISITCFKVGAKVLDIVGDAIGMVENQGVLKLQIAVEVLEPTFSFRVIENEEAWKTKGNGVSPKTASGSDANLRLDFGISCPIFAEKTRTVKIRNNSPYPSPFALSIEKFRPSLNNVEELTDEMENSDKTRPQGLTASSHPVTTLSARYATPSQVPALLKASVDPKFGFSSKSGQAFVDGLTKFRAVLEAMKRILSDGRGAAFHAVPSSGVIPPWGEVTIKVKSYNNLVGIYEDWLECHVGNITKRLPVRLGVVGIPIKFTGPQLVSKNPNNSADPMDNVDLVNFGSRVINPKLGTSDGIRLASESATLHGAFEKELAAYTTKRTSMSFSSLLNADKEKDDPGLGQFPNKKISVENHSPREVRLEWAVYVKHTDIKDKLLGSDRAVGEDDTDISDIITP
ncbi:Deleted in lung and esophageal cancer protein 1, partial [Kappamyces sp. JEL0680]